MGNLLLPTILLLVSLIGALILLRIDARRRMLVQRVGVVASGEAMPEWERETLQGIRVTTRPTHTLTGRVIEFLKIPVDVPQANIIPQWVVFGVGIAAGVFAYFIGRLYLSSPYAVAEGLFAALFLTRGIFGWQKRRYAAQLVKQLPDVIELLSATVTAGLPAVQGLMTIRDEIPNPTRGEFERVVQEITLGATADAALLNLYRRTEVVEYSILAVTLGVQSKSGGRLVETVQTLAETIRQRLAIAARGNALAAEAKLSAYVIALMPVVGGLIMTLIQPGYLNPLFYDPRGNVMLFLAVSLLLTGIYIMAKMIRASLSE
ncbi:MAG: type II secretion system F family protein [Acetobacteraceae bacterium]|nr:type II secretion system F family protein [Pseudomonadota bacterium]